MDQGFYSDWPSDNFKTIRTIWHEHLQMTVQTDSLSSQQK